MNLHVGPFSIPPFYVIFGFALASLAGVAYEKFVGEASARYCRAKRSIWRGVVVPYFTIVGLIVSMVVGLLVGLWIATPAHARDSFVRNMGL